MFRRAVALLLIVAVTACSSTQKTVAAYAVVAPKVCAEDCPTHNTEALAKCLEACPNARRVDELSCQELDLSKKSACATVYRAKSNEGTAAIVVVAIVGGIVLAIIALSKPHAPLYSY
jgi:hypothetical protein